MFWCSFAFGVPGKPFADLLSCEKVSTENDTEKLSILRIGAHLVYFLTPAGDRPSEYFFERYAANTSGLAVRDISPLACDLFAIGGALYRSSCGFYAAAVADDGPGPAPGLCLDLGADSTG